MIVCPKCEKVGVSTRKTVKVGHRVLEIMRCNDPDCGVWEYHHEL